MYGGNTRPLPYDAADARNDGSAPVIRSLLYVPASSDRFIDKAHERGADAIILDLEDAVAPAEKAGAQARFDVRLVRFVEFHGTPELGLGLRGTITHEKVSHVVTSGYQDRDPVRGVGR